MNPFPHTSVTKREGRIYRIKKIGWIIVSYNTEVYLLYVLIKYAIGILINVLYYCIF